MNESEAPSAVWWETSAKQIASESPRSGRASREERAIVALKRGDMGALQFLYVRYSKDVYRVVRSIVRDHHESEDLVQTVFMKLPRAIGSYERRCVPFAAWITRVARNAALDHLRARRLVPVEEVRVTGSDPGPLDLERSRALRQALERLPEEQRRVVVMRHIVGLTPSEIAARLDKSEPSVHGLHHRGRGALRQTLSELGVKPVTEPGSAA